MKNKLYICLFGSGKTYFCQKYPEWVDFDVGCVGFAASNAVYQNYLSKLPANIVLNVSQRAVHLVTNYQLAEVSRIIVVLPEKEMKQEIINRCLNRPDHDKWFESYLVQNYDKVYEMAESLPFPKIYLKSGQFLTDIINRDGTVKRGIKIKEA